MLVILNDPHPLDLAGWTGRLNWLRNEPEPVASREAAIDMAEMMIAALTPREADKRAVEAA